MAKTATPCYISNADEFLMRFRQNLGELKNIHFNASAFEVFQVMPIHKFNMAAVRLVLSHKRMTYLTRDYYLTLVGLATRYLF